MVGEDCQQIDNFIDLLNFQVGTVLANELLKRGVVEEGECVDAVAAFD